MDFCFSPVNGTSNSEESDYNHFKTFSSSFIYKQSLSRIWEIIKDVKKTSFIFDDFEPKIEFIKGLDSHTEGNEFKILWKGLYNLNIKVRNI
jgi:hypothetical protein